MNLAKVYLEIPEPKTTGIGEQPKAPEERCKNLLLFIRISALRSWLLTASQGSAHPTDRQGLAHWFIHLKIGLYEDQF